MKFFSVLSFTVLALASSLFLAPAQAAVVNFEGVVGSGASTVCPLTTYTESGYTLTFSGGPVCNNYIVNNATGNNGYGNATSVLALCAGCSNPATMVTLTGPGSFSFASLDIGSYFGTNPDPIVFTGYFSAGGTVSQTIDATAAWHTYALTGFSGLSKVEMQLDNLDGHASLDNLSVNVPEPASFALLGLGLLSLGLNRRRVQKRSV